MVMSTRKSTVLVTPTPLKIISYKMTEATEGMVADWMIIGWWKQNKQIHVHLLHVVNSRSFLYMKIHGSSNPHPLKNYIL